MKFQEYKNMLENKWRAGYTITPQEIEKLNELESKENTKKLLLFSKKRKRVK